MTARIVLASTSRYRAALLERLALPFEVAASGVDEAAAAPAGAAPREVARALAAAKAEAVAARMSGDALVIGGDQVVALEDEIFGKPGSEAIACAQLRRLAGKTHTLLTATAFRGVGALAGTADQDHLDVHRMTLRALSDAEIARYVARDRPIDCCGAYQVERGGIALFERIEGPDFTAITGLPLMTVGRALRRVGIATP